MVPFKSDLEWAKWFKAEFGVCPIKFKRDLDNYERDQQAEWDQLILEQTGYPNGHHPNAYKDIQIDWDIIAKCEADGYDWPTMPWLPAPWERKGKTYYELNRLAYERREQHRINKG